MFKDPVLKQIALYCLILNLVLLAVWFFTMENYWPWVKGQILGGCLAILLFYQMEVNLRRGLVAGPAVAKRKIQRAYILRLMIYALVMLLSIASEDVHLIGVLLGLVSMKYTVLVYGLIKKNK